MTGRKIDPIDSAALHQGLAVYALVVGAFLVLPLVLAVILAFSSGGGLQFPPPGFSLRWIVKAMATREFREGLFLSTIIAASTGVISAVAGTAAAIAFNHFRFRGRAVAQVLLMAPLSLPGIVIGLAILFVLPIFRVAPGVLATIAGHSVIGVPYVAYMVLASLANYDLALDRASASLGAGRWRTFRSITLPLISPGIAAGGVCAFLLSFDNVALSLFLSKGNTLPLRLMQSIQFYTDPSIAAVSVLLVLLSLGALPFLERAFRQTHMERAR
jgi:putative spermidine/putrescine transport system permease protein